MSNQLSPEQRKSLASLLNPLIAPYVEPTYINPPIEEILNLEPTEAIAKILYHLTFIITHKIGPDSKEDWLANLEKIVNDLSKQNSQQNEDQSGDKNQLIPMLYFALSGMEIAFIAMPRLDKNSISNSVS